MAYIDGKRIGDTPVTAGVTAGKHELRLDAPGYEPQFTRFEVGDNSEVVLDLEPDRRRTSATLSSASISTASSASSGSSASSASSAGAAASAHAAGEGTGHLTLTTNPRTTIYLDGTQVGQTPIQLTMPPGRHAIKMVGKDQRLRKTLTLDITAGQTSNLSFTFDD